MTKPTRHATDSVDLIRRAVAAFNAGRSGEAGRLCEAGLKSWPRDPALNHLLAAVSLAKSDLATANKAILLALAGRSDSAPVQLLAGKIHGARGDASTALRHYEKAIALVPTIEALVEYARLLTATGAEAAKPAWRAVLKADPRSGEAQARLGRLLWESGDYTEAAQRLETAAVGDVPASVWFDLGLVRQDLKDRKGAIAAYRGALAKRPDFAEAAVNLGILLQDESDIDAAMEAYKIAYRQKPTTFGMIATALTSAPHGRLWLDREALRRSLAG